MYRNVKKKEAEEKRLREGLQRAQKLESIGILAGGIAHDFNNILSSIIGYTELSFDDVEKNSVLHKNLKEIFTASLRAKDLVKQILTFARKNEEELRPVRMSDIVEETMKLLRATVPATIEIITKFDTHLSVNANPTRMHQIIMNLCTNAVHAMEKSGGVLTVQLSDILISDSSGEIFFNLPGGKYIQLSISDTGTGIPPDLVENIFEPYVTTKQAGEGTGLGLSVVHGIVKTYGGEIIVESEPGKGSEFIIYLPVMEQGADMEIIDENLPASGTERLLIVDDELPIVNVIGIALQRYGYQVSLQTDSSEALSIFRAAPQSFDLIVTDMTMPHLTGEQLAVAVKKIRPEVPVILCSGYNKRIADQQINPAIINAVLMKPVSKTDLANTVRAVLDGKNCFEEDVKGGRFGY